MQDRIKKIRKALDFTQQEFADKLGVKRNTVGQWECGINAITDQTITSICRIYKVNEDWLRYGKGEMFKPKTTMEELVDLTDTLLSEESTSFKNRLVSALAKLTDEQWDLLENIIDEISKKD